MDKNIKYIDMAQFPKDKGGRVKWGKTVGLTIDFYYYDKKHIVKILNYGKPTKDYIEIQVDDMTPEIVNTQKVRNLTFGNLFLKPNYLYNIGDTVNNSILILEQLYIKRSNVNKKHYKCRCLLDGYEFIVSEQELKNGRKCPKCVGKILIVGFNDIATTDPEIVKYLLDKEDARRYTRGSSKKIWTVCPICGFRKKLKIEELVLRGKPSCKRCSDGLSYPNKFAFNVFEQIETQYKEYISEYSPSWLGQMRFDNYIELLNGEKIIVEMDGGFHYNEYGKLIAQNDEIKDALAKEHGLKVIRVNCFYNRITERFDLVKTNFVEKLGDIFDLSRVNWEAANSAGISNRLVDVANYYINHPFVQNQEIAKVFKVRVETIRHYLTVAEKIGLCTYKRHDANRCKTSFPLIAYDSNNNLVGVFISARQMSESLTNEKLNVSSINYAAKYNKPYKGYILKRITWEEYNEYEHVV